MVKPHGDIFAYAKSHAVEWRAAARRRAVLDLAAGRNTSAIVEVEAWRSAIAEAMADRLSAAKI